MRRLFFAIPLPQKIVGALERYCEQMENLMPYARWTPPENVHITVLFLGNVACEAIPTLERACSGVAADIRPFSLQFTGATYAPPKMPPRMVWLGAKKSGEFQTLYQRIFSEVQLLEQSTPDAFPDVIDGKQKAVLPHVTLARFKREALVPGTLPPLKAIGLEGVTMTVDKLLLMESKRGAGGTHYATLRTFIFKK